MTDVVTYSGKKFPKEKCRKIGKFYYLIGDPKIKDSGECFKLFNTKANKHIYYCLSRERIAWDYSSEQYIIIEEHPNLVKGLVDRINGKLIYGYFKEDVTKNVFISISPLGVNRPMLERCWSKEVAERFCKYSIVDGLYHFPESLGNRGSVQSFGSDYIGVKNDMTMYPDFDPGAYNFDTQRNTEIVRQVYNNSKVKGSNQLFNYLSKVFEKYTFGLEIETSFGRIPQADLFNHGFVPLKDGSIRGVEYTSIPFSGYKGFHNTWQFSKLLKNTCLSDEFCSIHVHIGNWWKGLSAQETKLFTVAAYMLCCHLQTEIWEFLPKYKKEFNYLSKKQGKDHCQNLFSMNLFYNNIYKDGVVNNAELNSAFTKIFTFVNDGVAPRNQRDIENREHSKGDTAKWNIMSRYYAVNFYNIFFSNSRTLEFRQHSGTCNPYKILNWLIICLAIIKFVQKNYKRIIEHKEKFNLTDILSELETNFGEEESTATSKKATEYLMNYVISRKLGFLEAYYKGDIYNNEFRDKTYVPKYTRGLGLK